MSRSKPFLTAFAFGLLVSVCPSSGTELSVGEHTGRKKLVVQLAQGAEETKLVHSVVVLPK